MQIVKGRPTIEISFVLGCAEITVGQSKVLIPLEFVPAVAEEMQKLFNDLNGD